MADSSTSTQGWKFNQIGIRVSDLEKSLSFYKTVLGLEEINRFRADTVTVAFLGYPDGGTAPEKLFRREGVLEVSQADHQVSRLVVIGSQKSFVDGCNQDPAELVTNTNRHPGFGLIKLCFTVPDMKVALSRLKEHQVPILKEPGASKGLDLAADGLGISTDKSINKLVWEAIDAVMFAQDPDEYLIELIQQ